MKPQSHSPAALKRRLFKGALSGDEKLILSSLHDGADVHALDSNKWTPLHVAARAGNAAIVTLLLKAGADPNVRHRSNKYTPLYVTTFEVGHVDTVLALLAGGAAPSLAMEYGWTALHNAVENADIDSIRALLAAGATPNVTRDFDPPNSIADKFAQLIAELAGTPKQSVEDAQEVADRSKIQAPPPPHKDARALSWAKLRMTGTPRPISCVPGNFPAGYHDFMTKVGPGILGGMVRLYPPSRIDAEQSEWRQRIDEFWFWGDGPLLSAVDAQQAVRIADTLGGDELVFHPRKPNRLMLLPHEDEEVILISESGFLPALTRLLERAGIGRRSPTFEPHDLAP